MEEDVPHNKSNLLWKYIPVHQKIPVLVPGRKPIAESLVILEYIDESQPIWEFFSKFREEQQKAIENNRRTWTRRQQVLWGRQNLYN
ncbi:hypothetical protein V6N12_027805 [Hibiscus sabdariffa]|uniref:Glutathione S-transferase n=1 Tax=Hibiscus sabdariffa TaxID=183260 RepID=A0ABR2F3Y5_9ROSI